MNEFNQESLAATDKWGHQLSEWRWVTLHQNNQLNEKWHALCETLSLQYTARSYIIVTMHWFPLNDVPESIALQSAAYEKHTYLSVFDLLCPSSLHSFLLHFLLTPSPLSISTAFNKGCHPEIIDVFGCCCIVIKQISINMQCHLQIYSFLNGTMLRMRFQIAVLGEKLWWIQFV